MVKIPTCAKCKSNQADRMAADGTPICAGCAQLAMSPDDILDVYVPGRLRCPTCKFELTKATLFVQSGQIGASKAEVYQQSEPCPNDGEPMVRVTWREEADANREYAERLIAEIIEAVGVQSLPEAMEAIKTARAEALASSAAKPGTDLKAAWERFSDEELPPAAMSTEEVALIRHASRRAFYAGAQTFACIMNTAMGDEVGDEESFRQMEEAHKELEQAVEEMKL